MQLLCVHMCSLIKLRLGSELMRPRLQLLTALSSCQISTKQYYSYDSKQDSFRAFQDSCNLIPLGTQYNAFCD